MSILASPGPLGFRYNLPVDMKELFSSEGPLAAVEPRYEERPQQLKMACAVAEALERGRSLVVEAGTGVGKSLAYLLPGALWAAVHGRRLVVSTYTRALQEQILEKDLPVAAAALKRVGVPLRYAMLQGADNYLCVQRLSRLGSGPGLLPEAGAALLEELSRWAGSAKTGHRSSLPCLVPQNLWNRLCRDPDLCRGPGGPFWSRCLYRKDRERAEAAHVVVVNHALLLSGARLPPYDALVIDEAHNFEDTAASRFGLSVSQGRVSRLLEEAGSLIGKFPGLKAPAERCAGELSGFLRDMAEAHGFKPREEEPGGMLLSDTQDFAEPRALAVFEKALAALATPEPDTDEELELRVLLSKVRSLRSDLAAILGERSEETARWVEWSRSGIELRASPLEVAGLLEQGLFARAIPVVMTSATLSSGAGLGRFKAQAGLPAARELQVDSPFDYASQAALLVLEDLPEPSEDEAYAKAVAARCAKIVERVPGGLFILFSSWRMLRKVHEKLRKKIKGRPLWMQGAAGNEALLAHFIEAGDAVLLGVDTFWQGVDVPGTALSCVVLVKLPFPNFGSPVEEARRRWYDSLGRSYFDAYSLPRAVMKFRQGFGRLIRSSTDRGAVVVLDPRIVRRGYGAAFLEALPRTRRLETIEELGDFFSVERA